MEGPEAEKGSKEREGVGCAGGVVSRVVTGSQRAWRKPDGAKTWTP